MSASVTIVLLAYQLGAAVSSCSSLILSLTLSPSLSHCTSVPLSPSHTLPSLPVFRKPLAKSTQHARFRFRRCCCRCCCLHLQLSLLCYLLSASLSSPLALRGISSNHLNSFYHVITAAVVYQTHRRILASSSRLPYAPLLPHYPFSSLSPPPPFLSVQLPLTLNFFCLCCCCGGGFRDLCNRPLWQLPRTWTRT